MKSSCKIIICQVCPFQNMKKLKLDPLDVFFVQISHCLKNLFPALSRKLQNRMNDHFDIPFAEILHSLIEAGKPISPSDVLSCFFMDRLKPQLDPYRLDPVQLFQKIQYLLSQTVRSGSYRQGYDPWMRHCLLKNLPEIFHRRIGVGIRLKIRNIFLNRPLGGKKRDLAFNLLCDRQRYVCRKISASSLAAENTASCPKSSIPVWTGHPPV